MDPTDQSTSAIDVTTTASRPSLAQRANNILAAVRTADGRQIRHYLQKLCLPSQSAYHLTRGLRFVYRPKEYFSRRSAVKLIQRNPKLDGIIDPTTGYGWVPLATIPNTEAVVDIVRNTWSRRQKEDRLQKKSFRHVVLGSDALAAEPMLRDFILSDEILQIAADYLDAVPVLQSVQAWWSPVNDSLVSSQLFHRDGIDFRQVKFFLHISDIDEGSGPFTFLPANASEKLVSLMDGYKGALSDDDVFAHCAPEDVVVATGPAGSLLAVDSCRCFHFGSRARDRDRLVLMFNFSSYLTPMRAVEAVETDPDWYIGDPLRRLALDLPKTQKRT